MIKFCCPICNEELEVPASFGNQSINCPNCGESTRPPTYLKPEKNTNISGIKNITTVILSAILLILSTVFYFVLTKSNDKNDTDIKTIESKKITIGLQVDTIESLKKTK